MGSKAEYEARKAEREKLKDMDAQIADRTSSLMMLDMADRLVTAIERIANALAVIATKPGEEPTI